MGASLKPPYMYGIYGGNTQALSRILTILTTSRSIGSITSTEALAVVDLHTFLFNITSAGRGD